MAGVATLQPHDVLKHHRQNYVQPVRSRKNYNSTPIPNPNPKNNNNNNNNNRRKRSPQKNGGSAANLSTSPPSKNRHMVMGEVKILKRGEPLTNKSALTDKSAKVIEDFVLSTTDRLGPEPDMVPKQISIADFYAGSAFVTSPPPSELPVPAFFNNNNRKSTDDATSDLRRLLRLE